MCGLDLLCHVRARGLLKRSLQFGSGVLDFYGHIIYIYVYIYIYIYIYIYSDLGIDGKSLYLYIYIYVYARGIIIYCCTWS